MREMERESKERERERGDMKGEGSLRNEVHSLTIPGTLVVIKVMTISSFTTLHYLPI